YSVSQALCSMLPIHHVLFFFLYSYRDHRHLHSFPTRRSSDLRIAVPSQDVVARSVGPDERHDPQAGWLGIDQLMGAFVGPAGRRSEEHTSELQSLRHLVCRLLLEKKKKKTNNHVRDDRLTRVL